ncbi:MAG: Gfo/Idh/MocA family oxidoreductase [Candidatus Bathyarchaeia archaeon]
MRYAIVGAGVRALHMYAKPLVTELKDSAELVGIFDVNLTRAKIVSRECGGIPVFNSFEEMLAISKPETVIVTTVDSLHHEYIIRSLEYGCDVITEKPMTIDAEKCKAILQAEKKTGRRVTVTFNLRFAPYMVKIKEILKENVIGEVLSVDLEWFLDTRHGADYFRRWHRRMENSGGLLITKATHHFDLINWWLEQEPEEVFAFGDLRFYGPQREKRGERCLTCAYKDSCEFYWDITKNEFYKEFYLDAEKEDGYIRDGCVFSEDINIYDNMSVNVKYSGGALLTYSLVAYSPYEGWRCVLNGVKGRMEVGEFYSGQRAQEPLERINVYNRKGEVVTYEVEKTGGSHQGADVRLRRAIFVGDLDDRYNQKASSWDGALSVLIGAAANISIKEKRPISVKDLIQ